MLFLACYTLAIAAIARAREVVGTPSTPKVLPSARRYAASDASLAESVATSYPLIGAKSYSTTAPTNSESRSQRRY
jgi:hypothetical protein